MRAETWGFLATPPRDLITLQRRLRARRVAKLRRRQDEEHWVSWAANLVEQDWFAS